MKLTDARKRGLEAMAAAHPEPCRVSNTTTVDGPKPSIYWQTANWLGKAKLVDARGETAVLTDLGHAACGEFGLWPVPDEQLHELGVGQAVIDGVREMKEELDGEGPGAMVVVDPAGERAALLTEIDELEERLFALGGQSDTSPDDLRKMDTAGLRSERDALAVTVAESEADERLCDHCETTPKVSAHYCQACLDLLIRRERLFGQPGQRRKRGKPTDEDIAEAMAFAAGRCGQDRLTAAVDAATIVAAARSLAADGTNGGRVNPFGYTFHVSHDGCWYLTPDGIVAHLAWDTIASNVRRDPQRYGVSASTTSEPAPDSEAAAAPIPQSTNAKPAKEPLVLLEVPLDHIHPDPHNVRRGASAEADPDMVESIRLRGVLQPILVAPADRPDTYDLVCGHRRLDGARKAALDAIPAVVRSDLDERGRLEAQLAENEARRNLTALEEAEGFGRLVALGVKQKDIATSVGVSEPLVAHRLDLLRLPEVARDAVDAKSLNLHDAEELARLADWPDRLDKAWRQGAAGQGIPYAVRRELADVERLERIRTARDALVERSVFLVDHPGGQAWTARIERPLAGENHHDHPTINLNYEQHQDMPCHAAAVDVTGQIIWLCRDPARHPDLAAQPAPDSAPGDLELHQDDDVADVATAGPPPDRKAAADQARREREANRRRAGEKAAAADWEAAGAARREAIGKIIAARPAKDAITGLLLALAVTNTNVDPVDVVSLAGLSADPAFDVTDLWAAIEEKAFGDGAMLARLGLASALAGEDLRLETDLRGQPNGAWADERTHRFYAFLEDHGHTIHPLERKRLGLAEGQHPGTTA